MLKLVGMHHEMSFAEYREANGFGGTDAAYLALHTPNHWRYRKSQPPTAAMTFGTAAHCLILEGEEAFSQQYVLMPGFDRRTKGGKSEHLEFVAAHAGKQIITQLEYNTLLELRNTINNSSIAMEILEQAKNRELSIFWECPRSDVYCCARIDFMGNNIAGDLKTTADASPQGFLQAIKRYGYHVQAAHYLDGLAEYGIHTEQFLFIALETIPPYGVGIYELDKDLLKKGHEMAIESRVTFMEAEKYGYWGYDNAIVKLSKSGVVEMSFPQIEL